MRRHSVLGSSRSRAVAAAVLGGLLLAGCGGTSSDDAADPADTATPTGTVSTTPTTSGKAPAQFLDLTAQHLCAVQGEVYPDAAALADAFETAPKYPGIPADRVRSLTRRLETDPGFARDLNTRIAATCGKDAAAG